MSHVTTVDLVVSEAELPMLVEFCEKQLGLEFRQNQKTFKWFGQWANDYNTADAAYLNGVDTKDYGKCEHAFGVPNNPHAYEVGLVRTKDGHFRFVFDFWAGGHGLCKLIGAKGEKLWQGFAEYKIQQKVAEAGFEIASRTVQNDGKVQLKLRPLGVFGSEPTTGTMF